MSLIKHRTVFSRKAVCVDRRALSHCGAIALRAASVRDARPRPQRRRDEPASRAF